MSVVLAALFGGAAASPDLLEACNDLLAVAQAEKKRISRYGESQDEQHLEEIIERAKNAIAKARGKK